MLYGADILHDFRIHPSAWQHNQIFVKVVLFFGRGHSQQGTIPFTHISPIGLNTVICGDLWRNEFWFIFLVFLVDICRFVYSFVCFCVNNVIIILTREKQPLLYTYMPMRFELGIFSGSQFVSIITLQNASISLQN